MDWKGWTINFNLVPLPISSHLSHDLLIYTYTTFTKVRWLVR